MSYTSPLLGRERPSGCAVYIEPMYCITQMDQGRHGPISDTCHGPLEAHWDYEIAGLPGQALLITMYTRTYESTLSPVGIRVRRFDPWNKYRFYCSFFLPPPRFCLPPIWQKIYKHCLWHLLVLASPPTMKFEFFALWWYICVPAGINGLMVRP